MNLFDYTVVGCIVAENNYDECYCDDAVEVFARQNVLVAKRFLVQHIEVSAL